MQIATRYAQVRESLNERARRLFVASEALAYGYGGISVVSRATGVARRTIGVGIAELQQIEGGWAPPWGQARVRKPGAGRKKTTAKDPTLLPDLQALVEATTRGDPESPLLWTARSQRNLVAALRTQGHHTSMKMVARLLKELGYSLQANRKRLEGAQHPDRNAQFEHINETIRQQLAAHAPVISVDTKKKELVGPYKNAGRELRAHGDPEDVRVHDFVDDDGKVAPYGVYDLQQNEAWVSVGISHDTAEFAVETVRTWWHEMGAATYPTAPSLVITADGGGSNGYRVRLWKTELQRLVDELGFPSDRVSFAAGHEQVEQDRTPLVLVHHAELARQAADHPPSDRQPHRRDDDEERLGGSQPTRPTTVSQGPSHLGHPARRREPSSRMRFTVSGTTPSTRHAPPDEAIC